ncbi:phytoene/squalene synthase family protein [Amycolatopsis sp. K13G38]|uniref:Phytoene/squalene synthase family protein n=1 Tax=Amycolatopsis acididurans TaxID=2724524 RepID=A0ABX1IZG1_9PSEU|nr:phytoene/squalene synthase family protein [Amycolatopsis acididurans]NKQ52896.1 phytoene/squalene synthase family protein [Amycolatopsis acididurans]
MTDLENAYRDCRRINAQHGKTFFLATRLLPAGARPATHALYGFARIADEVVDNPEPGSDPDIGLAELEQRLDKLFAGNPQNDPVLVALADTIRRYGLDRELFDAFLRSMRMDLTVAEYETFDDLAEYTYGSASVIGLLMLPILGTVVPQREAAPSAAALGEAFQLTNFLRDIGEDLDRGRLYLPVAELAAFGVDRDLLVWCRAHGRRDPRIRRAMAALVAHARAIYRRAESGISLLRKESRPCVRTALVLYRGILDEIVRRDYDVLARRVAVGRGRRLITAAAYAAGAGLGLRS